MSIIERISKEELYSLNDPAYELSQLEKFREEFQTPNVKIQDVWTCFRLLPMQAQYLMASHHVYENWVWLITSKWQMVKELEGLLINPSCDQ